MTPVDFKSFAFDHCIETFFRFYKPEAINTSDVTALMNTDDKPHLKYIVEGT